MIKYVSGNIWDTGCDCIVVPVNTVGVMGAGLAKQCKDFYPDVFKLYKQRCDKDYYKPGQVDFYRQIGPDIVLAFTKEHWRDPSKYEWVERCLEALSHLATYQSVAIPKLGCGLGGLDWDRVKSLYIKPLFEDTEKIVEVYE